MSISSPDTNGFAEPAVPSVVINDPTALPICGEGVKVRAEVVDRGTDIPKKWKYITSDFSHWLKRQSTSCPTFRNPATGELFTPAPDHRFGRSKTHQRYGQVMRAERDMIVRYGDLHTTLLTLTAPVRGPGGTPHLPLDRHLAMTDHWRQIRQKIVYELRQKHDLDMQYLAINGPTRHGNAVGSDHIHIGIYTNGAVTRDMIQPILDKHIETCPIATHQEHPTTEAIQIREVDANDLVEFGADTDLGPTTSLGRYLMQHTPALGATVADGSQEYADVRNKPEQFLRHSALSWAAGGTTMFRASGLIEDKARSSNSNWEYIGRTAADGKLRDGDSTDQNQVEMVETNAPNPVRLGTQSVPIK